MSKRWSNCAIWLHLILEHLKAGEFHNTSEAPGLIHAWKDLSAVRKAVISFGKRDLIIRYIHTYLGWGWLVLPPILLLVPALAIRFGSDTAVSSYEILTWITVLGGHIVSAGLMQQISPLWINNKNFLTKVRLPILFLPVSRLVVMLPEWMMYSIIVMGFGIYSGVTFTKILLHLLVLQGFVLYGFSIGLLLCALSSRFRDTIHAVPLVVQAHLLLIVFYLLKGAEFQSISALKSLPPILLIETLKPPLSVGDIFLVLAYIMLLLIIALYVFVTLSHNAVERI